MLKRLKNIPLILLLCIVCFAASHGMFNKQTRAGFDTSAYPISQQQFDLNIKEGVWFPRWAPDMRFGYGHPKLQFRPPFLHYLAELFVLITNNIFFSINLAVATFIFIAGFGMYFYAKEFLSGLRAVFTAAAYVSFMYLLEDTYIRAAYYEVAAYSAVPWVLWAQANIVLKNKTVLFAPLIGSFAVAAVILGHPAIAFFFLPVAFLHSIVLALYAKKIREFMLCVAIFIIGLLIAAPYWFVFLAEVKYVRMQIFYTSFDSYHRNFISLKRLFTDKWPRSFLEMRNAVFTPTLWPSNWIENTEMLGWNFWSLGVLFVSPLMWFIKPFKDKKALNYSLSLLFYTVIILLLTLTTLIAKPLWDKISLLHTFNFPWRVMGTIAVCCAALTGITADFYVNKITKNRKIIGDVFFFVATIAIACYIYPKAKSWDNITWYMEKKNITRKAIRKQLGISSQFYTPKWVVKYPEKPTEKPVDVPCGDAVVKLIERNATSWKLNVKAKKHSLITIAQHYYPGWKVYGIGKNIIKAKPYGKFGLIAFEVEKGTYNVLIKFGATPVRILAGLMFIAGLILAIIISLKYNRINTTEKSIE